MQFRIAEGPTSTLGIGEIVTPEEVRSAFLALTKQYHPARFGRLSVEIQKLSNEVFLGIKGAHDHMLKALGSSTIASRGRQGIPVAQHGADGTSRTNAIRGSQSIPRVEGITPPTLRDGRSSSPAIGGTPTRSTPAMGVPIQRPTTGTLPTVQRPAEPTRPTGAVPAHRPSGSIPIQRPGTPPVTVESTTRFGTPVPPATQPGVGPPPGAGTLARPGTPPVTRPSTPVPPGTQPATAGSSQRMMRVRTATGSTLNVPANQVRSDRASSQPSSRTMPPVARPADALPPRPTPGMTPPTQRPAPGAFTPPTQPPRPDNFNPPTVRNVPTPAGLSAGQGGFDEAGAFREATALLEKKDWTSARQALHALAARVPQSKVYRAWLCYARGREAYIAGRPQDAILEMQRALQLEPDLAHAKHALTELQRRR